MALSTSGILADIVAAVMKANDVEMHAVCFTRYGGGKQLKDILFEDESNRT